MPPPSGRAASDFSLRRIGWVLCLLACCVVIGIQSWVYIQHRAWWAWVNEARTQYIRWSVAAAKDVRATMGDVEGLSRGEAVQRLQATFGPDRPYPTPPGRTGPYMLAYYAESSPREYPVVWHVREKDWWIAVRMYDGRADGLDVGRMSRGEERKPPRGALMIWAWGILWSLPLVMVLTMIAAVSWYLRRDHRGAAHACLMIAVLGGVALLAEDWDMKVGLDYQPIAFRWTGWNRTPWEGPAIGLAVGLVALVVPRRRPVPGICINCRYDLTGNVSGVCPECGTAVAPQPAIA